MDNNENYDLINNYKKQINDILNDIDKSNKKLSHNTTNKINTIDILNKSK